MFEDEYFVDPLMRMSQQSGSENQLAELKGELDRFMPAFVAVLHCYRREWVGNETLDWWHDRLFEHYYDWLELREPETRPSTFTYNEMVDELVALTNTTEYR